MRTQYIIASVWGLAACGGGAPTDPPSNQQGIGMQDKSPTTIAATTDPPLPPSSGSGMASSGQADTEGGAPSPIIINGSGVADPPPSSGAASGSSESGSTASGAAAGSSGVASGNSGMSQSSGAESGSVVAPPTCTGSATQACGNCASGTATRVCNNGVWSDFGSCVGAQDATLQGVDAGNFTISFDLMDTDTTSTQIVLDQETNCISNDPYWEVQLNPTVCGGGTIAVQHFVSGTGLQTDCASQVGFQIPASGYHVVIHRQNGIINIKMGSGSGPGYSWPDTTTWDAFSPVATGSAVCDKTETLDGTVSNLCVEKE
jgi:hypothetical protein